jgi:hypothetical protein
MKMLLLIDKTSPRWIDSRINNRNMKCLLKNDSIVATLEQSLSVVPHTHTGGFKIWTQAAIECQESNEW